MDTPKVELSGNFLIHADHGAVDLRTVISIGVPHESSDPDSCKLPSCWFWLTERKDALLWSLSDAAERQSILSLFAVWARTQRPSTVDNDNSVDLGGGIALRMSPEETVSLLKALKSATSGGSISTLRDYQSDSIEASLGRLAKMDAEIIAGYHKTPVRKDGEPIPINDLLQGFIDSKMEQIAAKSGIPQPGDPYPIPPLPPAPENVLIRENEDRPRRKGREFL